MKVPHGIKQPATLCVLKHENQFLLLLRNKEPNRGTYTPVGGKIDPHETPLQAAIRETFEETGIEVNTMKLCGILTETSPVKYNWIGYVYVAEIDFIEPPYCNEGTLKWVDFDEVLKVPTPKTDWFIYKYIQENRFFVFDAVFDDKLQLLEMKEEISGIVVFHIKVSAG